MALNSTAQSNGGRRHQAGALPTPGTRFAIPSIPATAVPTTADEAPPAEKPGGRHIALLTDRDSTEVNVAALQQQLAERSAAARLLTRQVQALTVKASAAATKIAELDSALNWAREDLVHRDNENGSLQRSIALSTADNTRLSNCLADSEASIGKAYVQLERMKAVLIAVERERAATASAADRVDQKRRNETSCLNARLEAMASCAVTADTLLAGLRRNLREKLELLQNLLAVKDRQLDDLKQSRSKLIERTGKLLEAFKARDEMLGAAEERNRALAARLAEAEAALLRNEEQLKNARLELQIARKKTRVVEPAREAAHADCAALTSKAAGVGTADNQFLPPHGPRSADTLLTATISL
jgi:chromosome segregation ATPase